LLGIIALVKFLLSCADISIGSFSRSLAPLSPASARSTPCKTHRLLDLRALSLHSYAVTFWGGSLFRIAIGAIPFLLPLLFQVGFAFSPVRSGLLVLAVFAGNLAMKPLTTPILRRLSFRTILITNGLLNAAGIFACAFLTPATRVIAIVTLLFASGMRGDRRFAAPVR
jgi:hypothetical protein